MSATTASGGTYSCARVHVVICIIMPCRVYEQGITDPTQPNPSPPSGCLRWLIHTPTHTTHTPHTTEAVPPEWAFTVHEALQKAAEVILHARAAPAPLENDMLLLLEEEGGHGGYGPTIPPSPYHRVNSGGSTSGGSSGGSSNRRSRVRLCVSVSLSVCLSVLLFFGPSIHVDSDRKRTQLCTNSLHVI